MGLALFRTQKRIAPWMPFPFCNFFCFFRHLVKFIGFYSFLVQPNENTTIAFWIHSLSIFMLAADFEWLGVCTVLRALSPFPVCMECSLMLLMLGWKHVLLADNSNQIVIHAQAHATQTCLTQIIIKMNATSLGFYSECFAFFAHHSPSVVVRITALPQQHSTLMMLTAHSP